MSLVELSSDGHVASLKLNRPEARNALSVDLCDAVVMALADVARDPESRVLVISGEGKVFCSGADFAAVSGAEGLHFLPRFERMLEAIARHRLPTIAAIHGAALGGGLQLATVCDFRVIASDASVGIPSAKLGILVNFENVQRLVLLTGIATAKDVLMTGRTFSAEEAKAAGLVDRVVESADLAASVAQLAVEISARAPLSVQGAKRAIQLVIDNLSIDRAQPSDDLVEVERLVEAAYNSRDLQEGIRAMKQKDEPEFRGI